MSNSIRHDFHSDIASTISDDIQYQHSKYYYYLGKVEPWGVGDVSPELMQVDSDLENNTIRSNMIYIKSILPNDVSLVIPRYNWVADTVFQVWDNTKNMSGVMFYCVTDNNSVYKCLDNNGGAASTVKPTGNSYYVTPTADGYLWKYMYNIPAFKHTRFSSLNFIPVQKSLTDSFYNKGSVDDVVVTTAGSGYTNTQVTTIGVVGATTGSGAAGTLLVGATGDITGVTITAGGTGYTAGVDISFISTNGVSGVGAAIVAAGVITGMTIVSAGLGYSDGDVIVFSVGGAIVLPMISRTTGSVISVTIIKSGAGYAVAPTLTINTSGGTGTGKYGNATALFTGVVYQGKLVQVNIVDPGVLYSTDISTTIVVLGDGEDAQFSPVIYNGEIAGIIVENTGVGYTTMKLEVVGIGVGAEINPILTASNFVSDQSIVEQTTIEGAIYSIQVVEEGNNYSTITTSILLVGDGVGCTAVPVIEDGRIIKVQVTSPGSGYTYANVSFVDLSRTTYDNNIDAVVYATLPPNGGHGFDAVSELFGTTLAINSSLRQESTLSLMTQDYRQFGILKNPTNLLTGKKYDVQSKLITHTVTFDNVTDLVKDEVLLFDNVKFRVIFWIGDDVYLQQLGIKYVDPLGILTAETENTRQYNSTSIKAYPEVNKYSGKLIYASNENPFSFTEDQGIIIKTFLHF